jgi:hypothetical protein
MWEFFNKVWTDLKMTVAAFIAFLEGKKAGRAELTHEQKEAADAAQKDFEAIESDGRALGDAIKRLRARRPAQPDRPPGNT